MLDLAPYLIALLGTGALCLLTELALRPASLMRCLWAVALVWCLGYMYGALTNDFSHWQFNVITDSAAAALILWHPARKMQAALGGTYAVQVSMHVAYGARALWGTPDPVAYYEMLTIVAYAQLLILGVWSVGIWGRAALDRWRHPRRKIDHRTGIIGMGREG